MPTYVYACQACGRHIERRQSFSDAPLTECEECGGGLRRVLQPVGIVFRGSGFYATDYAGSASSTDDGRASGGAPDGSSAESSSAKESAGSSSSSEASGSGSPSE